MKKAWIVGICGVIIVASLIFVGYIKSRDNQTSEQTTEQQTVSGNNVFHEIPTEEFVETPSDVGTWNEEPIVTDDISYEEFSTVPGYASITGLSSIGKDYALKYLAKAGYDVDSFTWSMSSMTENTASLIGGMVLEDGSVYSVNCRLAYDENGEIKISIFDYLEENPQIVVQPRNY